MSQDNRYFIRHCGREQCALSLKQLRQPLNIKSRILNILRSDVYKRQLTS